MFQKIFKFASQHKIVAAIIVILLAIGGYYAYKSLKGNTQQVRYVSAAVEKGTIVVSISGTGQVSASNQIDITPKVSGDVIYVGVNQGQQVKAGTLLVQLDATTAQKAVRDAQANLESAQLDLEKLVGPASSTVPKNKETALNNLAQAYDDGFNNVSNAFLNLPNIMVGLQNELFGHDTNLGGVNQQNMDYYVNTIQPYDTGGIAVQYRDDANNKYQEALKEYNQNFSDYKSASRYSDQTVIDNVISETYNTTKSIAEAIKSMTNLIQFYKDTLTAKNRQTNSAVDTHLSTLNTYTGQINTNLVNLLSSQNSINNYKDAVDNADLDVKSQDLSLKQKQNALLDAQQNLADYYVRAPFDGLIAALNVKKFDSIGASTAVATLITKQKLAEISLNEVDVSSVKIGQKATLTFDAIPDLNISGEVSQIDSIGTVSQGVVTYNVKIIFDTQDERVKPGMSVSAAIITGVKQDVLIVSNSSIKQQGDTSYVEIMEASSTVPQQQAVTTGLSNDTMTEITSGLKEGDEVVTQTITSSAASQSQTTNSSIRIPGLGGGGFGR